MVKLWVGSCTAPGELVETMMTAWGWGRCEISQRESAAAFLPCSAARCACATTASIPPCELRTSAACCRALSATRSAPTWCSRSQYVGGERSHLAVCLVSGQPWQVVAAWVTFISLAGKRPEGEHLHLFWTARPRRHHGGDGVATPPPKAGALLVLTLHEMVLVIAVELGHQVDLFQRSLLLSSKEMNMLDIAMNPCGTLDWLLRDVTDRAARSPPRTRESSGRISSWKTERKRFKAQKVTTERVGVLCSNRKLAKLFTFPWHICSMLFPLVIFTAIVVNPHITSVFRVITICWLFRFCDNTGFSRTNKGFCNRRNFRTRKKFVL